MHVLDANEIFWMTFYTYDRIMEIWWKRWADAVALYIKLLKQTRMQETNQTYTLNSFIEEYFGWGHERTTQANKVLKKLWLIDNVVIRWNDWKVQWHYVRVNYLIDEEKVRTSGITYNLTTSLENQALVSTTPSEMATNALSTQYINALSNIKEKFETFWKEYPHARKGKKKESEQYFLKQDANEVLRQVAILKWKIKAWLQDAQYIPACERWIRDFTELNEDVIKQDLVRICKWHLNAGWNMKERSQELKQTFGEQQINEIVKAVQQKDSPKNLFINNTN